MTWKSIAALAVFIIPVATCTAVVEVARLDTRVVCVESLGE